MVEKLEERAPGYLAMALASSLHLTPLWLEVAATATAPIAGIVVTILFMRAWREAVLQPLSRARAVS
jgi:hypothetical protein